MKIAVSIIAALLLTITLALFSGCTRTVILTPEAAPAPPPPPPRFEWFSAGGPTFNLGGWVLRDNDTKREYLVVRSGEGMSVTLMPNQL